MGIRRVEVIGPGCAKCKTLEASTRQAVQTLGLDCQVQKVSEIEEIIRRGIMATPALAIDGRVVSTGRLLSAAEIQTLLGKEASREP
jgi:small redox-active disulfide protein 2